MVRSAKKQKGRKVDCTQHKAPFKTLTSLNFPPDTVHLDLAHNALSVLIKVHLFSYQVFKSCGPRKRLKRKARQNQEHSCLIQVGKTCEGREWVVGGKLHRYLYSSRAYRLRVWPGRSVVLTYCNLIDFWEKRDLSNNAIGAISSNMFTGLPKLEKLFLSSNRISVIPDGTFNDLRSMKRISQLSATHYLKIGPSQSQLVHVEVRAPKVGLKCPIASNRTSQGVFMCGRESVAGLIGSQPYHKGRKRFLGKYKDVK
ncbi:hypothetical protein Btru_034551 [Bulinus truncatus]|nr:hypothetical protein Btru_034551 [Bulinus truncatus]